MTTGDVDRMPDSAFRMMKAAFALIDAIYPSVDKRVSQFGMREGMTVVDYGCGPGRYTIPFARRVGPKGIVYAVDVQELALEAVRQRMESQGLTNIVPVLATGYQTGLPDHIADMAFALDMFFAVKDPVALLAEIQRLVRQDGLLILDDGHQSRQTTLEKLSRSGRWQIVEESRDHLRCIPK